MVRHAAYAIVGSVLVLGACEKKDPAPPKTTTTTPSFDAAKKAAGDAAKNAQGALAESKTQAVSAGETALKELDVQLSTLKKKAADAPADTKPAIEAAVKDAEAKLAAARTQLESLKNASGNEVPKATADFQQSLTQARDSFKAAMQK